MNIISGLYNEGQIRVGIVATRFNEVVVSKLVDGAADGLSRHGVDMDTVDLAWVPGAFEVPLTAKKMAESGKYDAILCLGAVIRGETDHYAYVSTEVTKGIAQVSLSTGVPILYMDMCMQLFNKSVDLFMMDKIQTDPVGVMKRMDQQSGGIALALAM